MNQINNYSIDQGLRNKIFSFRINDLKVLLSIFGQNNIGRKPELRDRVIELLRSRPDNINYPAYITKIDEIYRSIMQRDMTGNNGNNIMMRSSLLENQQQIQIIPSMGQMQNSPQRIYQTQQYPQQSMHMERAGLNQVMPQRQVNNNIQYIAAGPSSVPSIVPYQLPPNRQMSNVVLDTLGLKTTANVYNSYTPSIETVAQIKLKKLPFYEVVDEVIKPTLVTGTDRCTLRKVPIGSNIL